VQQSVQYAENRVANHKEGNTAHIEQGELDNALFGGPRRSFHDFSRPRPYPVVLPLIGRTY
jgi:hypothetical protein